MGRRRLKGAVGPWPKRTMSSACSPSRLSHDSNCGRNGRTSMGWLMGVDDRVLLRRRQQHDCPDIPPFALFLQLLQLRRPKWRAVIGSLYALAFGYCAIKIGCTSRGVTIQKNENAVFAGVESPTSAEKPCAAAA